MGHLELNGFLANAHHVMEHGQDKGIYKRFEREINEGSIKVVIIPDIESINYGRGVGYEIIEHVPPDQVEQISATKIRAQMRKEGKL